MNKVTKSSQNGDHPYIDKRRRAGRTFAVRLVFLLTLIGGIGYLSWFSRWSHTPPIVKVEMVP